MQRFIFLHIAPKLMKTYSIQLLPDISCIWDASLVFYHVKEQIMWQAEHAESGKPNLFYMV